MTDVEIKPEITIIKRGRKCADCHHGGVWKIAYADFMTAMMAFFLVMWLINASNEETRAQVASYFNPVKLIDSSAQPRGLNDNENVRKSTEIVLGNKSSDGIEENTKKEDKQKVSKNQGHSEKPDKTKKPETPQKSGDEAELFRAPIETLDKIVGGTLKNRADASNGRKSGANTGELKVHKYRDPFAPQNWEVVKIKPANPEKPKAVQKRWSLTLLERQAEREASDEAAKAAAKAKAQKMLMEKMQAGKAKADEAKTEPVKMAALDKKTTPKSVDQPDMTAAEKASKKSAKLRQLKREIARATNDGNPGQRPQVNIVETKQGVLLSLSDDIKFGMFKVASAKPAKEMVLFMEKISKVLAKQPGKIVIRGHTDGRPFHSEDYDNWRLSSARAQIARYMLIRGGTDKKRFVRIEGHADRNLKVTDKPYDARNRRIEILLLD